jgi:hypothetical protein
MRQRDPEQAISATNTAIFIYDQRAKTRKRLTPVDLLAMDPVWSRDGNFIYFSGYRDREGRAAYPFKIYRIARDGTGLTQIAAGETPGTWPTKKRRSQAWKRRRVIKLWQSAAVSLLLVLVGAGQIIAQNTAKPGIEKAVFWTDAVSGTNVYLSNGGRLTVVSEEAVKVDYHTEINSTVPVDKRLAQTGSSGTTVRYFMVDHHFPRTTIWMTLEFTVGGKKVPALTRTFYNSIFEVVPTEQYFHRDQKKQTWCLSRNFS